MITRKQHLDSYGGTRAEQTAQHRAYYAQFAEPRVLSLVRLTIGEDRIRASVDRDGAFNDIPLGEWDRLVSSLPPTVPRKLKELGDYLTLGNGVCILKEAARQIREADELEVARTTPHAFVEQDEDDLCRECRGAPDDPIHGARS